MEYFEMAYNVLWATGEVLCLTWPGRLVLGMAVGATLAKWARV